MNPYKKIDRLEQRIHQLEQENQELRLQYREVEKCRKEYERNNRLAVRYQTEYHQLLHGLKQEQEEVRQLIQHLKYETGKSARTYRRAFHDMKNDIQICKSHT
ncbi:MAG: hypothetical protein K2N24_03170 [Lachnospiraceae bacterium]|nr:hypothetical protein [Lachnospiraceae bacterium]